MGLLTLRTDCAGHIRLAFPSIPSPEADLNTLWFSNPMMRRSLLIVAPPAFCNRIRAPTDTHIPPLNRGGANAALDSRSASRKWTFFLARSKVRRCPCITARAGELASVVLITGMKLSFANAFNLLSILAFSPRFRIGESADAEPATRHSGSCSDSSSEEFSEDCLFGARASDGDYARVKLDRHGLEPDRSGQFRRQLGCVGKDRDRSTTPALPQLSSTQFSSAGR